MNVIEKLASSLNRRDEVPNQELAEKICKRKDKAAIKELVNHLQHKNQSIQNDCIKVLYEIGERKPELIAEFATMFVDLLKHKNNRLQWGAMTALNTIVLENPKVVYASIKKIMDAANSGSVITKDNAAGILINLCSLKQYSENAFLLLNEQLLSSPTNQLPMYAESAVPIITEKNKKIFLKSLSSRLDEIEKESKRKRVEKVIRKFS
ncbi:MAG: adaptin domain-containing protein [Cyclobacteriaceae bacterium]|nr:adaptin domain-containing protein [Cyclobacteriaceae bacterium]